MSTDNDNYNNILTTCANCGKGEGGAGDLKACTACKLVKYCNRDCQVAHRKQHKRECKKRAAELHDEQLFKQPPPPEDCPICFLPIPAFHTGSRYQSCCGKLVCGGCFYADAVRNHCNRKEHNCPFCRTPARTPAPKTDEEAVKRMKRFVEVNDAEGTHNMACSYDQGSYGLPQDYAKALELWHRAAKLGHAQSYYGIGLAYQLGQGVERDIKKALYYFELGAIGGCLQARYSLGYAEGSSGNTKRALKHMMIGSEGGDKSSLDMIRNMFLEGRGHATKDDYSKALQAYQTCLSEIQSEQRDKAAAFSDEYKYYEV